MKITLETLDQYVDEMLTILNGDKETIGEFMDDYKKSRARIKIDQINYCLEKFINSELDYTTEGTRGLGRASTFWPRLGGYYRKGMSKLSKEGSRELDARITSLIIKSYLFSILVHDELKEVSKIKSPDELYQKWIPEIYRFNFDVMPQDSKNLLFTFIGNDFNVLKTFFKENDMSSRVFQKDKHKEILSGYIGAGIMMRIVEKF